MTDRESLEGGRIDTAPQDHDADAVVITGVGVVSALGSDADRFWRRLCAGQTGIGPLAGSEEAGASPEHPRSGRRPRIGAPVRDFDPHRRIRSQYRRRMDRLSTMIVAAAREALEDAGLDTDATTGPERARLGVSVGSAFGNLSESMTHAERLFGRGARSVSPMTFPNLVLNAPASYVAIELGATGANLTVSQLELSGEQAVLVAHDLLSTGRVDVVIAGGGDELAPITTHVYRQARALSGQRGGPEWSSPYDRARNGVVLGEGAAMLVLERRGHAIRRGAHAYAVLESAAAAAFPAAPYSWPPPAVGGALELVPTLRALDHTERPLDLILGSASSAAALDATELAIIKAIVAGSAETAPWLTSIKGATGEFGAAGALTTITAALALDRQKVPPLCALERGEDCHRVRYAPRAAIDADIERALVLGLARGGACTALTLRRA